MPADDQLTQEELRLRKLLCASARDYHRVSSELAKWAAPIREQWYTEQAKESHATKRS